MSTPKLIIFASGSKTGGGSGFQKLVEATATGVLEAEIVGVASNHSTGGVYERAQKLGVPFTHFPGPWEADGYRRVVEQSGADFVSLSGWLKLVKGLDPRKTFNIHPGPLPRFGGPGLYGHHVHEAVREAFERGELEFSEVSMHFVTDEYDRGPVFFRLPVPLKKGDTADDIGSRVNQAEHQYQAHITNLVVSGQICWDGSDPKSLRVPVGYEFTRPLREAAGRRS